MLDFHCPPYVLIQLKVEKNLSKKVFQNYDRVECQSLMLRKKSNSPINLNQLKKSDNFTRENGSF